MDAAMKPSMPTTPRDRWLRYQALWRRLLFFGLTFADRARGRLPDAGYPASQRLTLLEWLALLLFVVLFTWISGAFWTGIAGFVVRLIGHDPAVMRPQQAASHVLHGRTAIVMPIYNEDAARVFAGVEAIWGSLQQQPRAQAQTFDFFILSDTRKPDIAEQEERAWRALVADAPSPEIGCSTAAAADNVGRKSGNIAEFVRNWGGAYDYMIVLDADSIMSGQALVSLAQLMDDAPGGRHHPDAAAAGRPRHAVRAHAAVRGAAERSDARPAVSPSGSSARGNYWGHNAIIRMRPFAEYCALPRLPGAPPFGGEILSHDIVEAAFMRRAGYKVWLVPDIAGSWEEVPSNIIDFAARDRRWAQGNLQHIGVMPMRGLHWLSRLHLLTGILSYVSSPLWLLVLIISSIVTCMEAVTGYSISRKARTRCFRAGRNTATARSPRC